MSSQNLKFLLWKKRLKSTEDSKISAFGDLEDEISNLKVENQNLQQQLSNVGPKEATTIANLESRLSNALAQLDLIDEYDSFDSAELSQLQEDLASANSKIIGLEEKLKISENSGVNSVIVLEDELASLKNENTRLKAQVSNHQTSGQGFSDNGSERIAQLESQLEKAINEIENLSSDQSGLSDAELELSIAQQAIEQLTNTLDQRERAHNELTNELNLAFQKIEELQSGRGKLLLMMLLRQIIWLK